MTDSCLRIFCVLKTGKVIGQQKPGKEPEYFASHVLRLRDQVAEHMRVPHEFACLSNINIPGVLTIPLIHNWPGWWSKIELFRPDIQADINMYLDLDTTVKRDITNLACYQHEFTVLRNLSHPYDGRIGSGVMAWRRDRGLPVYLNFQANPDEFIQTYRTSHRWGDQGFIMDQQVSQAYWQDLFPGTFSSFVKSTPLDIASSSVVCFHGKPKPWDVPELKELSESDIAELRPPPNKKERKLVKKPVDTRRDYGVRRGRTP